MFLVIQWAKLPEVTFPSFHYLVRESLNPQNHSPGPGQYTKVSLLHKIKAP